MLSTVLILEMLKGKEQLRLLSFCNLTASKRIQYPRKSNFTSSGALGRKRTGCCKIKEGNNGFGGQRKSRRRFSTSEMVRSSQSCKEPERGLEPQGSSWDKALNQVMFLDGDIEEGGSYARMCTLEKPLRTWGNKQDRRGGARSPLVL